MNIFGSTLDLGPSTRFLSPEGGFGREDRRQMLEQCLHKIKPNRLGYV